MAVVETKIRYILFLVLLTTVGCSHGYIKSRYPIPGKSLAKLQVKYQQRYGYLDVPIDTVIVDKTLCRIYKRGFCIKLEIYPSVKEQVIGFTLMIPWM